LQCYIEFDVHTIVILKKLLGSRSFGTIMGHLARCQVIFFASSRGLGLPSVVQHATPTFLECWALIALALIFHFQHDDHFILFDVVAYVKIGIFPFQVTLRDTRAMLPEVV